MKGVSLDEFKTIVEFIQKHHKFGYVPKEDRITVKGEDYTFLIKYIDSVYDSRDESIWIIKLRGMGNDLCFSCNHFNGINPAPAYFKYTTLFDWVMDYLKGDWSNNNILNACRVKSL